MKQSNALDLEEGVFSRKNPKEIAKSLKRSADQSTRRKSTPFRSAMSMLSFHINRSGRKLNPSKRAILEKAKGELRALYGKEGKTTRSEPGPPAHHITRFQVMAVLQAARALILGLNLDEAKSWGLNRALFYAAAKQAWQRAKIVGARRPRIEEFETSRSLHDPVYVLGGEQAFRARSYSHGLRFKFGREIQTPEDFDHQIVERFGTDWEVAWKEALEIVRRSHRRDLDIRSRFFNYVYKPRRDKLAEKWSRSKA